MEYLQSSGGEGHQHQQQRHHQLLMLQPVKHDLDLCEGQVLADGPGAPSPPLAAPRITLKDAHTRSVSCHTPAPTGKAASNTLGAHTAHPPMPNDPQHHGCIIPPTGCPAGPPAQPTRSTSQASVHPSLCPPHHSIFAS